MKYHVLNSAMMPQEGTYVIKEVTKENFCELLKKAHELNELESYIGYTQNINLIKKWCGIELPFSRKETVLEDGDIMLVMKLSYRPNDVSFKHDHQSQKNLTEDDFKFFIVTYSN